MKQEGDRKICQDCQIEIHVRKVSDSFGERLRWSNPDGSSHFTVDEETKQFVHTPTKATKEDIRFEEFEERLVRVERQLGIERIIE